MGVWYPDVQMVSVTFDTHKVVKDLQDAGFDEVQAEAVVNALGNAVDRDVVKPEDLKEFATKADIAVSATKADLAGVREEVKELRQDMAELRQDMTEMDGNLRTEMKALELRLTVRLTGVMIATVSLAVAVLKLFP